MSVYGVEKFVFTLKKDARLQQLFRERAEDALAGFPLTDVESVALRAGDLPALYQMGVHPLLLAPYARFMNIKRPDYQRLLDPLRGTKRMRSAV